jgi:hypothetical protein
MGVIWLYPGEFESDWSLMERVKILNTKKRIAMKRHEICGRENNG